MAELRGASTEYTLDTVSMQVDNPDLDLAAARTLAKARARDMDGNAMMLSYHSGKTGESWPSDACGGSGRPPWIVFAEARGYNLKIDINNGEYEFFYLRF
ncbi:AF1514 family protein [Desulfosarcina sp.]|uniref:AF1514 family protein n=1 Tax=Desulfosarcina sp. TaxID=2027861 RepID=UPI0039709B90